jgi:hypothetical protein
MRRRGDVARLVDIVRSSDLEQQYRKQKSLFWQISLAGDDVVR